MTQISAAPYITTTHHGTHTRTTQHNTRRSAEAAAQRAIKTGAADTAAVWTVNNQLATLNEQVAFFGSTHRPTGATDTP